MTTSIWTTNISMANTASLRAWGSELNSQFVSVGLVQTADTGQVNWSTVNLPIGNTLIGYEIWRFNDAMQASYPIYIRLAYYTAATVTNSYIATIQIGTSTDGAGNLTGYTTTAVTFSRQAVGSAGNAFASTTLPYASYLCCTAGFLGLVHKQDCLGTALPATSAFIVQRTVDASGAPNGEGVMVIYNNQTSGGIPASATCLSFVYSGAIFGGNNSFTWIPFNVTSSLYSGGAQVFKSYGLFPRMRTMFGFGSCLIAEYGRGTQFQATLVGTTPRNYICVGANFFATTSSAANYNFMLWE